MIGHDIQFAFQYILMSKPFADMPYVTFEVQVGVTQLDATVVNRHLAVGVLELDGWDINGFRQTFRDIQHTVLEVDLQARIPLE